MGFEIGNSAEEPTEIQKGEEGWRPKRFQGLRLPATILRRLRVTKSDGELFDRRSADALTSAMCVLDDTPLVADDPEWFEVVSDSGRSYMVDLRARTCTCPDCLHRGVECRHIRRAVYASRREHPPEWVNSDAIDPLLGEFISE